MKKTLSLLLVCIMLLATVSIAGAAENENVIHTLAGYNIIDADEEKDMTQPVTRGEFASMVTRLMNISESAASFADTPYLDVPSNYEFAGDISVLTSIGIMNGYSAERFAPKDFVTYEQALKVLILVTGYGEIALGNGGWPNGYITQASRNKMLGGVKLQNPFSRADLYRLVYNTLDVPLVSRAYTTGGGRLEKTGDTLRNQIAGKIEYELYRHKGIISANSYTYTSAPYSDLYDDEVVIDNLSVGGSYIYNIGNTNAFDLVGYEVEFYARKTEWGYELLSVKPTNNNETITVSKEDFGLKNGLDIKYEENGRGQTIALAGDYKVIYNGTRVLNPADEIFNIADGYFTFINNDSDKSFEIVMIWEYQNAIATSFDGTRLVFATDAQYASLTSFAVNNDNKEIKIIIVDKNGKKQESFSTERVASIYADKAKNRYKIVLSDDAIEGSVSMMDSTEGYTINGKTYKPAASLTEVSMGTAYTFFIDHQDRLAFAEPVGDVNYGYIYEYGRAGNSRSIIEARMIVPGKVDAGVETNEEDVTDTSAVPYLIMQNEAVEYIPFAEKVRSNGSRYQGSEILDLLEQDDMKAVSYKLNEEGKIYEITPLEKCGGNVAKRYQYDVYDRVFGGTLVEANTGFAINSDTVGACIPANDAEIDYSASEDDLNVRINITVANNTIGYRVEGYDYNPVTKKARFLMIFATMDSTAVTEVDGFTSKASIVLSKKNIYNEEKDDYDTVIEVLQGNSVKTLIPMEITSENTTIEDLKVGDLIAYKLNKNDLLANAHIMQSLPALYAKDNFETVSGYVKKSYGKAGKISHDEVDTYNRALVTKLELYTDNSGYPRTIDVKQKNAPPVYLYNSNEQTYTSVSYRDIIPESDQLFIYERNGDGLIRAIVIFR